MTPASFARLLILAAIWGASFLFLRIAVPALGPVLLIGLRVGLGALFLFAVSLALHKPLYLREHWQQYLVLGWFSSALPFLLYAFAAKTLSASLMAILNATSPIWAALIAALWTRSRPSVKTMAGLIIGVAGVALLVGLDASSLRPGAGLAALAALGAAFSYGIATNYARRTKHIDAYASAHGTMWAATLIIAPALPFFPASAPADAGVVLAVVLLGVVCSGIAYLLYFRLVADLGAPSALTVTFLIPVFGILWGHLFLGEAIGWQTLAGSLIVLTGTALVTGFSPASLFTKNRPPTTHRH